MASPDPSNDDGSALTGASTLVEMPLKKVVVVCPRCKAHAPTGLSVSDDIRAVMQGTFVPCAGCGGVIVIPDMQLAAVPSTGTLNLELATDEFAQLLHRARAANQLYFLWTLMGWRGRTQVLDYMLEINRMTSDIVSERTRASPPLPIHAHESLFILQANLEAKAFYGTWRNFINLLVHRPVAPEPWDRERNEISGKGDRIRLSTGSIVRNIVSDLEAAGLVWLSREFDHTHSRVGALIRHATAHATWRCPSESTGGAWVFGRYSSDDRGHLKIVEYLMSHDAFSEFMRRFLSLRLAAASAFRSQHEKVKLETFEFQAENQMKTGEMLECTFVRGDLQIKYRGTPLW